MINIIGNIFGTSGYAIHTRCLTNALSKIADVKLDCPVPQGAERELTNKELELIKKPKDDEINLIITVPNHWRFHMNAKRNWVYLIWEGDKLPEYILKECLNPDIEKIIVASNHTKNAIKNKEILKKVHVISHGVDLEKFYPMEVPKTNFTFLCNKGFRNMEDRGGIQYALKAFIEEFKQEENVQMIIKINPAYGVPNMIELIKKEFGEIPLPKMHFIGDAIPYNQLVNLYNSCDVFVSPTRSEAFNIPCLEAMACGKPVITTNFGGQTDFCNNETGWIVGGKLEEVQHELQYEGIKWLTPDIKELRKCLRDAYMEDLTLKKQIAKETAINYTWDRTAQEVLDLK